MKFKYKFGLKLKLKYADINDRLDIDIKNKKKICMNRINQLNNLVENNLIKLDKMKQTNEILKKELEEYELKIMEKVKKKLKLEYIIINLIFFSNFFLIIILILYISNI